VREQSSYEANFSPKNTSSTLPETYLEIIKVNTQCGVDKLTANIKKNSPCFEDVKKFY